MTDSSPAIRELRALYRVSQAVHASLDLNDVVREVLQILADDLGMQRGTLALVDADSGELAIEVAHGLSAAEMRRGRYRAGEGVVGRVLETGQPMVVPNIGQDPLFLDRTGARRQLDRSQVAFLCVPVRWQGETVGVMSADQLGGTRRELDEDLRLLTIVAGVVAQAVGIQHMLLREKAQLRDENLALRHLLAEVGTPPVVGSSAAMLAVRDQIELLARSSAPVLITGERGSGRKTVALAIHSRSPRADQPFVAVPCAPGPSPLLHGHLFGDLEGVPGDGRSAVERAGGGTLYLDEVGHLSAQSQTRLLQALQEQRVPGADGRSRVWRARLLACSSQDLAQEVKHGRFHEELYHRLNGVPIHLPPLRQRKGDLPALARHFLDRWRSAAPQERTAVQWDPQALDALARYPWPGNVAELGEAVVQTAERSRGVWLRAEDLPPALGGTSTSALTAEASLTRLESAAEEVCDVLFATETPRGVQREIIERVERVMLQRALQRCGGTRLCAARLLGINRNTLYKKLELYELS